MFGFKKKGVGTSDSSQQKSSDSTDSSPVMISSAEIKSVKNNIFSLFDSIGVLFEEGVCLGSDGDLGRQIRSTCTKIDDIVIASLDKKNQKLFKENLESVSLDGDGLLSIEMKGDSPFDEESIRDLEEVVNFEYAFASYSLKGRARERLLKRKNARDQEIQRSQMQQEFQKKFRARRSKAGSRSM